MKTKLTLIILLTTLTITLNAYSCGIGGATGGSKLTWQELKQCADLSFMAPHVKIDKKDFSIFTLCQNENLIRSIHPEKTKCFNNDSDDGDAENKCQFKYFYLNIFELRDSEKEEIQEELLVFPQVFNVRVYKKNKLGESIFFFEKKYILPKCHN